jgi:Na+-transporting NADH:ubiquinone oxidoreductase subunit NqrB
MANGTVCYTPVNVTNEKYVIAAIDIEEMMSIGVAVAALICSVMQSEIMLDT